MSAGWQSGRGGSIVARHEWKGLSKMHGHLEDWVEKCRNEQEESSTRRQSSRVRRAHLPGAFDDDEEEEEEEE